MCLNVQERIKELLIKEKHNGMAMARILRDDGCPIEEARNGFLKQGFAAVLDNKNGHKYLLVSPYQKTTMTLRERRENGSGLKKIPWF